MSQKFFIECKDCKPPIRHPGCHSKCEKYLASKAAYRKEKEKEEKKKQDRVLYENVKGAIIAKTKRKYGMKPRYKK